jgi:hypothetical protein
MSDTPQLLSTKPIRKWGHSHVVSVSPEVRAALGVKLGDWIAFRKVGRYVVISILRAASVIPVSDAEVRQARAALEG